MKWKLAIWQKGLILVSVPLLFEFFFVGALADLLANARKEARAETQSKEIVSCANDLSNLLVVVASSLVQWNFGRSQSALQRSRESSQSIQARVKELEQLTADDPTQHQRALRIQDYAKTVCSMIDGYNAKYGAGGISADFTTFRKEMNAAYAPFLVALHQLADEERRTHKIDPMAETQRQERVNEFLMFGLAANLIITIGLALFFSRSITSRLAVLMNNTKNIVERRPLDKPISGADEIAQLDSVFHDMAESLAALEQAKKEFTSMVCHDLRAPLASVQATLALACKGKCGELNEKGQTRFAAAEQNIDRIIGLINEMLEIDKLESGTVELNISPHSIESILREATDTVHPLAEEKNIALETTSIPLEINVDKEKLVRVIVNLLGNAIKFSPTGSTVSIDVEHDLALTFSITDSGPGIDATQREKIFDRFYQVAGDSSEGSSGQGIGLGLAICQGIVNAHGGKIGVRSAPKGTGSRFIFTLPTAVIVDKEKQQSKN